MLDEKIRYGMKITLPMSHAAATESAREALAREGFGILCEIDVAATLKKKLDVDVPPYVILGACNPPLAHQALTAEPDIGLLLPCNVIVYATGESDRTVVAALDPVRALEITGNDDVRPVADAVRDRLRRVLDSLEHETAAQAPR